MFFQRHWDEIGQDVLDFVIGVFRKCSIPREVNKTLTSLRLKVKDPENIKQFTPISLSNISYKIITKVLVQRPRLFLNGMISPNQSSFLLGRGTKNNYIVASEILHPMKNRKGKGDGWR